MAASPHPLRLPAPVARWFGAKTRGERRIVVALGALVAIALLWTALWQPLVRDAAALRVARAGSANALAAARAMADEIAGLARNPAAPAAADARAGLERVLAQRNLRSAVTQLDWQEGRARIVFAGVDFDALVAALEALQREAQLRAVEATIAARVEPGIVRAELTLAR
jgi:general secretion pathway protein M